MKIIITILMLWGAKSYGLQCTASPTNKDPSVIAGCYGRLLSHFEEILKEQISFTYANHLATDRKKLNEGKFRRKYYGKLFEELEQIQKLKKTLNYPNPNVSVRCEAPSGGSE